jgi:ubiquinone/menaquinone biosynthesis C-methylase UbiE
VVPVIGGLLSDKSAYRYLPRSMAYLPPAPTVLAQLVAAGFAQPERRLLSGGITQLYTATATGTATAATAAAATNTTIATNTTSGPSPARPAVTGGRGRDLDG